MKSHLAITGQTQVFGIIGQPLGHSASPAMHGAAYISQGLDAVYVPFPVNTAADIPAALAGIRALSIKGINVTVPYKEAVIPFLDALHPVALQMGAVNTIVNRQGVLTGYNTDGDGFVLSLQEELSWDPAGKAVALIGAGGSARGIAFALCRAGISALSFHARTPEKAMRLCLELNDIYPHIDMAVDEDLATADLVIQTTPVGMQGTSEGQMPVSEMYWVRPQHVVVDIVYKPAVTAFMAAAQARGARVLGGAGMLAGQGILAYELFTGKKVAYQTMKQALM